MYLDFWRVSHVIHPHTSPSYHSKSGHESGLQGQMPSAQALEFVFFQHCLGFNMRTTNLSACCVKKIQKESNNLAISLALVAVSCDLRLHCLYRLWSIVDPKPRLCETFVSWQPGSPGGKTVHLSDCQAVAKLHPHPSCSQ